MSFLDIKKKLLTGSAVVVAGVTSAVVPSAHAAFTGDLSSALDTNAQTAADQVNWDMILGLAKMIYTMIVYAVHFVTQPAVLGLVAVLAVMGFIATKGYKKVISKITGGGGRRRRK